MCASHELYQIILYNKLTRKLCFRNSYSVTPALVTWQTKGSVFFYKSMYFFLQELVFFLHTYSRLFLKLLLSNGCFGNIFFTRACIFFTRACIFFYIHIADCFRKSSFGNMADNRQGFFTRTCIFFFLHTYSRLFFSTLTQ